MNKLINFYVNLYIGDDTINGYPRIESKRMWYFICHLGWCLALTSGFLDVTIELIVKLIWGVK